MGRRVEEEKLRTFKKYDNQKSVFKAAIERTEKIFELYEDDKIVVMFSGGKDSTAILFLTLIVAQKLNRKFSVFFVDQEFENNVTVNFVDFIRENYKEYFVNFTWLCATMWRKISFLEERVIEVWSDDEKENIRPFPEYCTRHDMRNKMPKRSSLLKKITASYLAEQKMNGYAFILGLRAEESLRRYIAVTSYAGIENINWSSKGNGARNYNFYSIYDWYEKDVWKFIHDYEIPYNKIYDIYFQKNLPFSEMRTASIINTHELKKISIQKEIDIDYYEAILKKLGAVAMFEEKSIAKIAVENAQKLRKQRMNKEDNKLKYGKFKRLKGETE